MMSMEQMYQAALRLPEQRLLAILAGQDDSLPQAVVGAALRMRKRMQQGAQAQQAQQMQGEPTQKDKMLAEYGGIANLPAEFDMSGPAERGIASFAEGGVARRTPETPEEREELRKQELERLRGETGTAPQLRDSPFAQYYDRVYAPSVIAATSRRPSEEQAPKEAAAAPEKAVPLTPEQIKAAADLAGDVGAGGRSSARDSGGIGTLVAAPKRPDFKDTPALVRQTKAPTLKGTEGIVADTSTLLGAMGVEKPRPTTEYIDEALALGAKYGVNRDPYAKLRTRLEQEEARQGENMQRARSEALLNAGLGMLGGRSQYAGVNIARGVQSGVDQYRADRDRLEKASLERAKALADIEKANSDIARGDVDKGMAARAKAVEAYQKSTTEAMTIAQRTADAANRDAMARYQIETGVETSDADRAARDIQTRNELAARLYSTDAQISAQLQAASISAAAQRYAAESRGNKERYDRVIDIARKMVEDKHGEMGKLRGIPNYEQEVMNIFASIAPMYLDLPGVAKRGAAGGLPPTAIPTMDPSKIKEIGK